MAASILSHEVSDLCLGKPALSSLSVSATVGEALSALKRFGDLFLSVWSCDQHHRCNSARSIKVDFAECKCIGKVCLADVICFLSKEENLKNPGKALQEPVSLLLNSKVSGLVRHLEPHASLLEAIDLILEGAQNLVIPLHNPYTRKKLISKSTANSTLHNNREYCWLTQEDIVRYLLNSIGLFSPTPNHTIESLNIIDTESFFTVHYDDPAALPLISQSLVKQTSVAILDADGKLIGEISPFTLNFCDETVAAAIATLSAGELMAYIECGDPPEDLIMLVKERLEERNLGPALDLIEEESGILSSSSDSFYSSSSDEEFEMGRSGRVAGNSARAGRSTETIVCYPWSSLVAVMIQALSHRLSYTWVIEEDGTLAGVVTFAGMIKVLRERLRSMV
ncbi:PREDICTED: CBS domain-containing protein CBSX5-like [Populus euphratica]|uniref:CBS domain-containing protein CBSX5-like n=1 Tax=Populus euphratica TaxID=75702 RepID=A0AAJ6XR19_POPEU|nr:PREDICTED: CBS domain-containing protein CBSX5-like [Populus euphratica]XP_011027869.1 PREDICTED: CBS domain-containing protein CBSX5-like [Populus euphratica]